MKASFIRSLAGAFAAIAASTANGTSCLAIWSHCVSIELIGKKICEDRRPEACTIRFKSHEVHGPRPATDLIQLQSGAQTPTGIFLADLREPCGSSEIYTMVARSEPYCARTHDEWASMARKIAAGLSPGMTAAEVEARFLAADFEVCSELTARRILCIPRFRNITVEVPSAAGLGVRVAVGDPPKPSAPQGEVTFYWDARLGPQLVGGFWCLVLSRIREDSELAASGLKDGDVIVAIDGQRGPKGPNVDHARLAVWIESVQKKSRLTLQAERDGKALAPIIFERAADGKMRAKNPLR